MIELIKNFWMASIKRQLILGIASVHMVMMSFFVYDLVNKEKTFLNTQHQKKALSLSKTLAANSSSWLLSNDIIGLEEVVNSIKHYPGLEYVLIINKSGQILGHSNPQYLGKFVSDERSKNLLTSKASSQIIFEGQNLTDAVSPILRNNKLIGWARIAINKDDINLGLEKVRFDGIAYTILAILVGILFAYLMGTGITKSIFRIIQTIKETKKSNRQARVHLNRVDEIGMLSREFDEMLDKIEEQNQLINSVIDSTPDLIFFKDYKSLDGQIIGCNNAFCEFLGKNKIELIGKNDFELFDKDIAESFRQKDKDVLNENRTIKNEEWVTYPNGEKVLLDTLKTPLYDRNKELIGVLGLSRNITQRYEIQNELDKKNILIYQQSKLASLGEMIGNIAHQWRQPLSNISTLASGIKLQKEFQTLTEEELNSELDNIVETTQFLSKTIDDFRNFYSIDKEKKEFLINNVVEKVLNLLSANLKNKDINIVLDVEDIKVLTFENELIQVFLNIINNAKDALVDMNEEKYIFISCHKNKDKLIIKIYDNAGGIKEDILPRIYEPYFTTKFKSQGTGIGLYMSKNIVENSLLGEISTINLKFNYNNKNFSGALFEISLPLK